MRVFFVSLFALCVSLASIQGFAQTFYKDPGFSYSKSTHDLPGIALYESVFASGFLAVVVDELPIETANRTYDFCTVEFIDPYDGSFYSGTSFASLDIASGSTPSETDIAYLGGWGCDVDRFGATYVNSYNGWGIQKILPPVASDQPFTKGYANSDGTNNDASDNTVALTVVDGDEFILLLNRIPEENTVDRPEGIQGWKSASATAGRQTAVRIEDLDDPRALANDGTYVYIGSNDANHTIYAYNVSDYTDSGYYIQTGSTNAIIDIECDESGKVWVLTDNKNLTRYEGISGDMNGWSTVHSATPDLDMVLDNTPVAYQSLAVSSLDDEFFVSWSNGSDAASGIYRYTTDFPSSALNWTFFK